jgi:hypothetical protein
MKRIVFFLTLLLFARTLVMAQNQNIDKLNAYKIAFFTKRLGLSTAEAEKFWPVYNEFQDKKLLLQQERNQLNRNINLYANTMSEKELTEAGDKYVNLIVKEAELAQEFHKKFREILNPQKVIRLYQAENQYRLQLLNELQDRRETRENLPINRQ